MSKTVNNADQINAVITTNGDATASVDFTPTQDTHVVNKAYVDNVIPNVANDNLLINGDMSIWQRGTSFGATGFTADHWRTTSNSIDVVKDKMFSGTVNSIRLTRKTSAGSLTLYQPIELSEAGYRGTISGNYTLSFSAKTNSVSTPVVTVVARFADDSLGTNNQNLTVTTISAPPLSTDVQYYEFLINTDSADPIVTSQCLLVGISTGTVNIGDDIEITNVKLEKGSQATPFVTASRAGIGGELALCRRFFRLSNLNTRVAEYTYEMREAPTVSGGAAPYEYDSEI